VRGKPTDSATTKPRKPVRSLLLAVALMALVLAACDDTCVFCDTETRPATAAAAVIEANKTLDSIGETTMEKAAFTADEWIPDTGCATNPDNPEQGDVGRVVFRTYSQLPSGTTADGLLGDLKDRWEKDGLSVSSNSTSDPEEKVLTRINGIGYYLASTPPGAQLRAFIPCY